MRTKMLVSSLIVGVGLVCAPAAFAQNAKAIGTWPVETDIDSMFHFERMDCFKNPQQLDCIGFDNSAQQVPAAVTPTAHHAMHHTRTTHHG